MRTNSVSTLLRARCWRWSIVLAIMLITLSTAAYAALPPQHVMLLPGQGTLLTNVPSTIRAQFMDRDGFGDIKSCFTLISDPNRSFTNAVYLQYNSVTNKMYLRNDADTAWSAGYAAGSAQILSNSQCRVYLATSKVTGSGNYVNVDWVVELKTSTMAGRKLSGWSFVYDKEGLYDGWVKSGEYTTDMNLSTLKLRPNGGALPIGSEQIFATQYYDTKGVADISRAYLLIHTDIAQVGAVLLAYDRVANAVSLKSDDGTTWSAGVAPGTATILENSQCIVNVADMTVTSVGRILTVNWPIQLKPSVGGKMLNAWTYLSDISDTSLDADNEKWKTMGVYYNNVAPTAIAFRPNVVPIPTGTPSVVSAQWSDANRYGNLGRCYLLLSTAPGNNIRMSLDTAQANAIYVRYNAFENKIFLMNDANTDWGTGYTPGASAILSNSQGSIDVSASTVTHPDANTIKLDLMLTPFLADTTDLRGWAHVRDTGGALSDCILWTSSGSVWTPGGILGSASTFGNFGGISGMTNQGILTVVHGDIGSTSASTLMTGFHDSTGDSYTETGSNAGLVTGRIYTAAPPPVVFAPGGPYGGTAATKAIADAAAVDALAAYNYLMGLPTTGPDPSASGELGGLTLAPGVYKAAGDTFSIAPATTLTLDALGNANAVWVFQMGSSLTVGQIGAALTPANVVFKSGIGQPKNVYWQVGSAATINTGANMVGTIIAPAGITFSTAGQTILTTLDGRALGLTASVTMVNTIINVP